MSDQSVKRIHRATGLVLLTTILFGFFFQVNKSGPFREINPFLNDPYDAVGSIAVQVALLVSLLSYARVLRWRYDSSQEAKVRLILRGNCLVLLAIFVTLCTDLVAEFIVPLPVSYWGRLLRIELAGMFLLALACGFVVWLVYRAVPVKSAPSNLTLADAMDDLWSLVRVPVTVSRSIFPSAFVEWIQRMSSDRLFARVHWIDPRKHSWRFACLVGLLAGILLILGQLQEGPPPSLATGLLVMGIFLSVELMATLAGYTIFGVYLGLRPGITIKSFSM